ncbi:MAG TPA: excalibur calcium-binding domain-containing protein [Allosphingosinicella sp.]|jgi:predicted lipid-binding transport protein (Tim44 family)
MSFRKPFRGVPIVPIAKYRARAARRRSAAVAKTLGAAMLGGLLAGSLAATGTGGFASAGASLHEMAVSQGLARRSTPAVGDYWRGCNAAREAGVAPLYAGEPGYRAEMDRDGDGIACEPHRRRW